MSGARWAFDAMYIPVDTLFLQAAAAAGLAVMSGYELFIYQGANAFVIFCDRRVDEAVRRQVLLEELDG